MSGILGMNQWELQARHRHIEEKLSERETAIANEAFITGRIYTAQGERESPDDIHEKLINNCKQAVKRL